MTDYKNMKFRDDHEDPYENDKILFTTIALAISLYLCCLLYSGVDWKPINA